MRLLTIFAYDGEEMFFSKSYSSCMRLPFTKGWDKWVVMEIISKGEFHKVYETTTYKEAEAYVRANSNKRGIFGAVERSGQNKSQYPLSQS